MSGLFRGSQLNLHVCQEISFYLDDADITLRSDHLSLKRFLEKNTLHTKVNNWPVETEQY